MFIVNLVLIFFLVLTGPFSTFEFSLGERIIFWVISFYAGYILISAPINFILWYFIEIVKKKKFHQTIVIYIFCAAISSLPLTLIIKNLLLPILEIADTVLFFEIYLNVLVIAIFITIVSSYLLTYYCKYPDNYINLMLNIFGFNKFIGNKKKEIENDEKQKKIPQIIKKLLPDTLQKSNLIYALESQDHYIKIITDYGNAVVLLRFKDACNILKDYPGVQIHRSYWIGFQAVKNIIKNKNKKVILITEQQLPISRSHYKNLLYEYSKWLKNTSQ